MRDEYQAFYRSLPHDRSMPDVEIVAAAPHARRLDVFVTVTGETPTLFMLSARPSPDSVEISSPKAPVRLVDHDYVVDETEVRLTTSGLAVLRWLGERGLLPFVEIRYSVVGEAPPPIINRH
jgi:hypothetical protein